MTLRSLDMLECTVLKRAQDPRTGTRNWEFFTVRLEAPNAKEARRKIQGRFGPGVTVVRLRSTDLPAYNW